MSNLKCPFCQQELDYLAEDIYGNMYCPNCRDKNGFTYKASESIWQELIRTRKALEQITDALEKEIKSGQEFAEYMRTRLGRAKKQLKDADIALEIVEKDFGGTFSTDYRTLLGTIRDARERIQKELDNE